MLVSDIWTDLKSSRGIGNCVDSEVYSILTDSVRMLANKSQWDCMIGRMTICASDGYIVLPREVEVILGATIDGIPAFPRDKWFEHHINGPGHYTQINGFRNFYDEQDRTPIFRCIDEPSIFFAVGENSADNGKIMLVYGYDITDRELYHIDADGNEVAGIRIPISDGTTSQYIDQAIVKKITRVVKPKTAGAVRLWGYPNCADSTTEPTLYGFYYPDQTEPLLRKYRFPKATTVTIHYRRAHLVYNSQNDWIPFENKLAVLQAAKAVREYGKGEFEKGAVYEQNATRLLVEEEGAQKQKSGIGPQIQDFSSFNAERLRGWGNRSRGYGCR